MGNKREINGALNRVLLLQRIVDGCLRIRRWAEHGGHGYGHSKSHRRREMLLSDILVNTLFRKAQRKENKQRQPEYSRTRNLHQIACIQHSVIGLKTGVPLLSDSVSNLTNRGHARGLRSRWPGGPYLPLHADDNDLK